MSRGTSLTLPAILPTRDMIIDVLDDQIVFMHKVGYWKFLVH